MLKLRRLLLLPFLLLCTAQRCDGPQEREGMLEMRVLQQSASGFIEDLFAKETAKVLERSAFPFYFNHQAILSFPEEWHKVLLDLFVSAQATPVQILSVDVISSKQMEAEHPRVLANLLEYGFEQHAMLLVTLNTVPPTGKPHQEKVLLLIDQYSGKVRGFAM